MNIDKKNRSQLKGYFVKNSIPTEQQFADLIDGMLIQKEDGIAKTSVADPLSIQAAIDTPTGLKKVINFYENFQDNNPPAWTFLLNPRTDPAKPDTAKSGFCISDGQGVSRLFIDKDGKVGIGTTNPSANSRLNIVGGAIAIGSVPQTADAAIHVTTSFGGFERLLQISPTGKSKPGLNILASRSAEGAEQWWTWGVTIDNKWRIQSGTSFAGEAGLTINSDGNVGIGITAPDAKLTVVGGDIYIDNGTKIYSRGRMHIHGEELLYLLNKSGVIIGMEWGGNGNLSVQGAITPSAGSANNGIIFPSNPGGGGGDIAWIKYYSRFPTDADAAKKEQMTLEIGVANDANDHIALMPSGNVGIGTNAPLAKLSVIGTGMISDGSNVAVRDGRMISGSLTIGSTTTNYGGGSGWNTNTAGLMLETLANTEIAVHDSGTRIASLMYYEGDANNRITIGRDMGWGVISSLSVKAASIDLSLEGNGGGHLILTNNRNDNRIYLEAFSTDLSTHAAELLLTGKFSQNVPIITLGGDRINFRGATANTSDMNLKKDIEELQYGLEEVNRLRPVSFNWKGGTNLQKNLGLIAQDVQGIIDEIVYVDDNPEGKSSLSISYTSLIPVLINAIKELDTKIKQLESSIVTG